MNDPWESNKPVQESLDQSTAKPEPQPKFRLSEERERSAADRKQLQPTIVSPTPPVVTNSAEVERFLQFNRDNLVQGVIWGEILGKPKAKRGRCNRF